MLYQLCRESVAWSELNDAVVVVQLERDEVHLANPTASFLLERLKEGATYRDLVAALTDVFDVDMAQARDDVSRFLEAAVAKGLVVEPLKEPA